MLSGLPVTLTCSSNRKFASESAEHATAAAATASAVTAALVAVVTPAAALAVLSDVAANVVVIGAVGDVGGVVEDERVRRGCAHTPDTPISSPLSTRPALLDLRKHAPHVKVKNPHVACV